MWTALLALHNSSIIKEPQLLSAVSDFNSTVLRNVLVQHSVDVVIAGGYLLASVIDIVRFCSALLLVLSCL